MNPTSLLHSTRAIIIPLPHRSPTRQLAARLGLRGKEPLLRRYGGRGIAAGIAAVVGFLGPAMWARLFGDLRDVAALRLGRRAERHTARNISIAVGAVAGVVLINLCVVALLSNRARP
jgi:hypothetical protein